MSDDMLGEVLAEAEKKMAKAIEVLEHDLTTIRTGRANPGLVDRLQVDYYGSEMPLNQLASISIPEARLIVIQPWDKSAISAIEKKPSPFASPIRTKRATVPPSGISRPRRPWPADPSTFSTRAIRVQRAPSSEVKTP